MSLSNLGAVMNQIQGFLASEFGNPNNQGLSILAPQIERVLSRADLNGTAHVSAPVLFDGTNDVDVSSAACHLVAVVGQTLAAAAEDEAVLFYNTTSPTEGTTLYLAMLNVPAGGTAATARAQAAVYTDPVAFGTAMSWSVVDNGSNADIEGTTLGDASGTRVMVVWYAD